MTKLTHVIKRDGTVVPFTPERIANAIYRAAVAVGVAPAAFAVGVASITPIAVGVASGATATATTSGPKSNTKPAIATTSSNMA